MLRKEEILERTSNGLAVFKHYLPGNWRIGRNFLNPLYEDSKASCNIYFDRLGGISTKSAARLQSSPFNCPTRKKQSPI